MANILLRSCPQIIRSFYHPSLIVRATFARKSKKDGRKKKRNPYIIVRAERDDFTRIIELMWRAYYPEEPTTSSLGIKPNVCMDQSMLGALQEGISMVAKCKYNGDIVGACINETTNPWDPDLRDKLACTYACPKMRALKHFEAHLQRMPNLWKCYDVPKIFEISYLFVRRDIRCNGLGYKLIQASRSLAADCGYQIVRVDATSYFTAKICQKMKMKLVAEVPYCAYVGEDLSPIFNPPDPHRSVKVYVDHSPHIKR